MIILADTRQKVGKHDNKLDYWESVGISVKHEKLSYGDYMAEGINNISIDTKQNLNELMQNFCTKDSKRVWREIRGAHKAGIKLVFLIEDGKYNSIADVVTYADKYMNVSGKKLADNLYKANMAYGCEFVFCKKKDAGRKIVELLSNYV